MTLNPDCVRAILLTIEENSSYQSFLSFEKTAPSDFPYLAEYSPEEILYHVKKCDEAGFLCDVQYFFDSVKVGSLHFRGHEFLANVRTSKVWEGTKDIAKKIGTSSLQGLTMVAANVVTTLIKSHFGLA